MDVGQKYDLSVREKEIYEKLKPMTKVKVHLDGIKLNIKEIVDVGTAI